MYAVILSALFVHCLLLVGMFDVYFHSPIVPNLKPVPTTYETPARRLVLFIGDGLRADHFYNTSNVPFLRKKIESGKAVYGISHTRVPTESRPGTVAIGAGVYEDPSAVFEGWQHNPVAVDSFFNRCRQSFAWGSPDIVHLFSKGASNIDSNSYSEDDQKFDSEVSLALNRWVFNEFSMFVTSCKQNTTCLKLLNSNKISFFFHFIGIDMEGHKSKPFSESYIANIKLVDNIVRNISLMFDDIFQDDKTAFVFTSDHGMTTWGSHGAGSKEETETPIVVWGSGVNNTNCRTNSNKAPMTQESNSQSWFVSQDCFTNVEQADIAVLMSTLLGVEIPTNNMGTIPVNYLNFQHDTLISALLLNANQLLVMYTHLEVNIKAKLLQLFFNPFPMDSEIQNMISSSEGIQLAVNSHASYEYSISKARHSIDNIKQGIVYYQTYFQNYLLFLLSSSFLGVIAVIIARIFHHSSPQLRDNKDKKKGISSLFCSTKLEYIFISSTAMVSILHFVQSLPISYYIYSLLPIVLWCKAIDYLWNPYTIQAIKRSKISTAIKYLIIPFVGMEMLYLSFYHRWILSVVMALISFSPLLFKMTILNNIPAIFWSLSSLILSIFPLLPTVGVHKQTILVVMSGLLWLIIIKSTTFWIPALRPSINTLITKLQLYLMVASILTISYIDYLYTYYNGLTFEMQLLSWTILSLNFALLTIMPKDPLYRMLNMAIAFGITFLMLSISFESLFLPILTVNMGSWFFLENQMYKEKARVLIYQHGIKDLRIAQYFLFLIFFSFFGIGNIDSVNSFDINWVRCFIDVFSPFLMTSLIILKTMMPFFLVSCILRLIITYTKADAIKVLLITLIFCEAMGLQFLFAVTNTGSWLDIGKSISHYIIMEVCSLIIILVYSLSGNFFQPIRKYLP